MSQRSSLPGNARLPVYPLRVFRVDPAQSWSVWFLGTEYHGIMTRFQQGRGQYVPREEFDREIPGKPLVWKGYASALVWDRAAKHWLPVAFELTERLELDVRGRYQRGQVWEVSRSAPTKKTKQPPCRGQLLESKPAAETPPEMDLLPCLRSFYHRVDLDLGVLNPMPPLTMVQPFEAPGPGLATSDKSLEEKEEDRLGRAAAKEKLQFRLNGVVR